MTKVTGGSKYLSALKEKGLFLLYEYKFIRLSIGNLESDKKTNLSLDKLEQVICETAIDGWELVQVLMPMRNSLLGNFYYEVIFKKEQK